MPLKGAKRATYNKKYYTDNKDKIFKQKKVAYHEDLEKIYVDRGYCVIAVIKNLVIV